MKDFFSYYYRFSDWRLSRSLSDVDKAMAQLVRGSNATRVKALAKAIIKPVKNPNTEKEQNTLEYESLVEALGNGNAKKGELYLKHDLNVEITMLLTSNSHSTRSPEELKLAQSKLKELEARFKTSQQSQGSSPPTLFSPEPPLISPLIKQLRSRTAPNTTHVTPESTLSITKNLTELDNVALRTALETATKENSNLYLMVDNAPVLMRNIRRERASSFSKF